MRLIASAKFAMSPLDARSLSRGRDVSQILLMHMKGCCSVDCF